MNNEDTQTKTYYAYMLRCADDTIYSGYSTDPIARLKSHNLGRGAKYTRARLPVALAYVEAFDTKSEAMKREAALKKLTRSEKQDLILGFAGPCAEKITLRLETKEDRQIVEELTREAFWNVHEPGCSEHYLAHIMRDSELFLPELDFVAEINGKIVGNIMYMRSSITDGEQTHYPVITFGPISVLPKEQGKGVGSKLIEHTLKLATDMGYGAVLIYGDPEYYKRFGFVPAERYSIRNNEGYYAAALLALELREGALSDKQGCFIEGEIYDIDEQQAEAFDRNFPPKEKSHAPSQDRFAELVKQIHK